MRVGWKFDPDGVLIHVGVLKVDGNLALLVGEGGLGVGFEDVAGKKETLAGGGAEASLDLQVDDEGLLVVFELVDGGDFDFKTLEA